MGPSSIPKSYELENQVGYVYRVIHCRSAHLGSRASWEFSSPIYRYWWLRWMVWTYPGRTGIIRILSARNSTRERCWISAQDWIRILAEIVQRLCFSDDPALLNAREGWRVNWSLGGEVERSRRSRVFVSEKLQIGNPSRKKHKSLKNDCIAVESSAFSVQSDAFLVKEVDNSGHIDGENSSWFQKNTSDEPRWTSARFLSPNQQFGVLCAQKVSPEVRILPSWVQCG